MRRITMLAVVATIGLGLQACNCAGREFTQTRTFSVHAEATDPLCSKELHEVNLGKDEAFNSVRQFVSRFELRKLAVAVNNPKTRADSLATLAHGSVQLSATESGATLTLGTYGDVPIQPESRQDIAIDKAAADELSRLALHAPNVFWVVAEGCNDKVPAFYDFDVIMTFYAGL